jgi:hypothetical protein
MVWSGGQEIGEPLMGATPWPALAVRDPTVRPSGAKDGTLATSVQAYFGQPANDSVLRRLATTAVQPKLAISKPGDAYEQEADQVADKVMGMPDAVSTGWQPRSLRPALPTVQRACAACAAEEETVLRKEAPGQVVPPTGAGEAQPFGVIGSGQPLPRTTREYFEPRFGRDLGDVRIHIDTGASQSAKAFNSLAYTLGRHIVFGQGKFAPSSDSGRRLLAHELAHVVQQSVRHRPMLARQLAQTPGYTAEQDQMLNCMIRAQHPAAGVVSDKEAFDICAKDLDYRGEFFVPTEDDRRQIVEGVLISAEDLRDYADALKTYSGWVRAGRVSLADRREIDPRIDFCERLLRALNLEASSDEAAVQQARAELSAAPAVGAAIPVAGAVVSAPSASGALAQNAANWGAGELAVPAEWAAGTTETAIVTGTTEAGLAAGAGEAAAVGAGAAVAEVVLPVAAIALAAYLSYRLWKWASTVEIVRPQPEIPDTIRDVTRRLRRITPLPPPAPRPREEPRLEPRPREDERRRRRRRCRYPTGLWEYDPIEIIWFKYKHDYFYPPQLVIQDGILNRDDPNARLPDGTKVGVRSELWPECNKIYQYIPSRRGSAARDYRQVLARWGYDWGGGTEQPDHIKDLAWNGPDAFGNLWPYEQSTNQSTGSSQNLQQRISFCPTPNGSPIVNERIVSNRGYLYGRYFIIKRFKLHSGAPDLITCP